MTAAQCGACIAHLLRTRHHIRALLEALEDDAIEAWLTTLKGV